MMAGVAIFQSLQLLLSVEGETNRMLANAYEIKDRERDGRYGC